MSIAWLNRLSERWVTRRSSDTASGVSVPVLARLFKILRNDALQQHQMPVMRFKTTQQLPVAVINQTLQPLTVVNKTRLNALFCGEDT